jgi:hypothetical protein
MERSNRAKAGNLEASKDEVVGYRYSTGSFEKRKHVRSSLARDSSSSNNVRQAQSMSVRSRAVL